MNKVYVKFLFASILLGSVLPNTFTAIESVRANEHVAPKSSSTGNDLSSVDALQKEKKKSDEARVKKEDEERAKAQLQTSGKKTISQLALRTTPVNIFVQLKEQAAIKKVGRPKTQRQHLSRIKEEEDKVVGHQTAVKERVLKLNKNRKIKASFGYLVNGFTTTASLDEIQKIEQLPEVESVSVDKVFTLSDTNANDLSDIGGAWQETGTHAAVRGENMVVAVLDSGIDIRHKDLRISEGVSKKIDKNFVETVIHGSETEEGIHRGEFLNEKVPFAYNYADRDNVYLDTAYDHHGQHVAGIIAANGVNPDNHDSVVGVAPEAQLLDMKVFGNHSKGLDDMTTVIDAIEDSVKLGADVLNMSFGASMVAECNDPEQVAIKNAAE
ncbi:MAG: S8 family serine peptidase, partial [Streptococcaceae bacterium]|nr:S8 family serine peptidase [Streptococcaceae bacterium]